MNNLNTMFQKIGISHIEGNTVRDIIKNLIYQEETKEIGTTIRELCRQYGEERLTPKQEINGSCVIYQHFKSQLEDEKQEQFITIYLDNKNCIIEERMNTKGILNKSLVHPREVYGPALELRAASIICVHNHPSGDPSPSNEDKQITEKLKKAGEIIGIRLLDHIIIGKG